MLIASVVVPTYNRRALLERCLRSLMEQSFMPQFYEIVVADDEVSESTAGLVRDLQREYPEHQLVYVPVHGRGGPACARNTGCLKARGDIIAFTDDDCVAYPHWLEAGIEMINADASAAWGTTVVPLSEDPTDYEISASQLSNVEFVAANCFCLKSVLREIGGFDERFRRPWREDTDLYFNLLEHNKRICYVPQAIIEHPLSKVPFAISLVQQRNNFYEALLFKKHPTLYRAKIPSAFVGYYYAILFGLFLWLGGILSSAWGVAVIGASIWLSLFLYFFYVRIRYASKHPKHVLEMALTSLLIPPLTITWRLAGAIRYKVIFF